MSFFTSVNGQYASIADINQFVDSFNGVTTTTAPLVVLGSSTIVPYNPHLGPHVSGGVHDFMAGGVSGASGNACGFSWRDATDGYGTVWVSDGTNASYPNFYGYSGGWRTDAVVTVGGALGITGTASGQTLTVNGNLSVSGNLSVGTASNLTVSGLQAGATWQTSGPALTFTDDPTNGVLNLTAAGTAARGLHVQSTTGGGVTVDNYTCNPDGTITFQGSLALLANSLGSMTAASGGGSGTFSHGLGTAPSFIQGSVFGASTGGINTYNWFGNTSTFQVNSPGAWRAICVAY